MNYDQLLFSELRLAAVTFDTAELTEENLVRAMTVNEELLALGYTLSPRDVLVLTGSADADGFAARIREYIGDVKAKPMYPDFPSQVMALDEAVFRFHQMVHYLSTYGLERLTGMRVTRGWLPEMQDTEKTEADETLLAAKTVALLDVSRKYSEPYQKILSKTERMTDKEQMIIAECAANLTADELAGTGVKFKQNLLLIFNAVFTNSDLSAEKKRACLHAVCQHTGDVWKCMDYALTHANYHLRTSQKRLLVKLLESYPLWDFTGNLILSNKKRERTLLMLQFLDFNEYSRKPEYKKAVADLRQGKLRSWESETEALVARRSAKALDRYAERPGMMLRHLTFLIRSGYTIQDISDRLAPHAAELSPQTLVSLLSFFMHNAESLTPEEKYVESVSISRMLRQILRLRLEANETVLRGKKVFVNMPEFDLSLSEIRITNKSAEGGYIRSGLAYRIPENVRCIRFFIYWNDKERVDVDLHASAFGLKGEQIHIGWNANFKGNALVFSGDITHSDAAEYIDIDFDKARESLASIRTNINLFSGYPTFSEVHECFVGAMAVSETGENIRLYNPKNCFFTHYLTGKYRLIQYGYIDVQHRVIVFDGLADPKASENRDYYSEAPRNGAFSLRHYFHILFTSQGVQTVDTAEEADIVLVMGKPNGDKEVSLIDNNFFLEG